MMLLAVALLALALLCLAPASAAEPAAAMRAQAIVRCAAGRGFSIRFSKHHVTVSLDGGQVLRLARRASSLGKQYSTHDATLIIDGDFVAFVMKDDLGFEDCRLAAQK